MRHNKTHKSLNNYGHCSVFIRFECGCSVWVEIVVFSLIVFMQGKCHSVIITSETLEAAVRHVDSLLFYPSQSRLLAVGAPTTVTVAQRKTQTQNFLSGSRRNFSSIDATRIGNMVAVLSGRCTAVWEYLIGNQQLVLQLTLLQEVDEELLCTLLYNGQQSHGNPS